MPPINLLIKPASSVCNMRCAYCFYHAIAENRNESFMGMMSYETLETLVADALAYADSSCGFAFQGGEPTMAGLHFFREVIRLQKKYNTKKLHIYNAIQTNGCMIDEEWAEFFRENNFLVGISLDGDSEIHNMHRVDARNKGTFNRVYKATQILKKKGVEFNILSVVTGRNAKRIRKTYQFFKKCGFSYLQFIPCLEPIEKERGSEPYHLSVDDYGDFLINLFDMWYEDLKNGKYISIRHLDNMLSMVCGREPEVCSMRGICSVQLVVEGDGSVYPCDFYVFDEWKMGYVGQNTLKEMMENEIAAEFIRRSLHVPEECKSCRYGRICRNGCRRDRITENGVIGKNYYCEAYRRFYSNREKEIGNAMLILQKRYGG